VLTVDRLDRAGPQQPLPLATDGVERYVWHIHGAEILIEVEGDAIKVNASTVEPYAETVRKMKEVADGTDGQHLGRRPRCHGGNWRLAPWILDLVPPHTSYSEQYGGATSVLPRQPRIGAECRIDLDAKR
jgi:hypothetical protein